jgi:hypothetical protein
MLIEAVVRAAHILRKQPGYTMPLAHLHAHLVREFGPEAGTYGQIYRQLQKRAESFVVLDSAKRLAGTETWPRAVREEYSHALDNAGFGCCVRVTLTEALPQPEADGLIAALNSTMAHLVAASEQDAAIKDYVERATEQLAAFSRAMQAAAVALPTTLPPDLPSGE